MQQDYNIDSDSDEGELAVAVDTATSTVSNSTWHLHDIEKLKAQTAELLDGSWKDTRNKHLLNKMLELEQPAITVKMVDFLLQDGVCDTLLGFITMNEPGAVRPAPSDSTSPALKKSYRAVILLSPDNPTEALNAFLSKKAALIARKAFDMFRDDSAGSFYHAYRLLESLLRCYPAEVFEGISGDGLATSRVSHMLRYIGFPPVCELLIMLISLTPVPRTGQLYLSCAKARWAFLGELIKWNLMLKVAKVISSPDTCNLDSYVNADQHATAAAQLFQEIVEKLSLEEAGETLLNALGESSETVDVLLDTLVRAREQPVDGLRRSCARMMCFLLRRAADVEILCYTHHPNGAPPTATYVSNHLYVLRESLVNHCKARLPSVLQFLQEYDSLNHDSKGPTKYSTYEVARPFTSLRALAVEVIVLMVESDESVASTILTAEIWVLLIGWAMKYPHNNVYHALLYRLVFAVLRQDQEGAQRLLFQKAKFASFLVENFVPDTPTPSAATPRELTLRRVACRGLVLNCANAVRLQVNSPAMQAHSYLQNFFASHPSWQAFLPVLTAATDVQLSFGMGVSLDTCSDNIKVNNERGGPTGGQDAAGKANEDHQVRFARSLGFYDEGDWSLHGGGGGRSSKDEEKHINRRRSFEEGYG